jgi:hypothetical protein
MSKEYQDGYTAGAIAQINRILNLLNAERNNFVFNSAQAFILDEMLKLIEKSKNV